MKYFIVFIFAVTSCYTKKEFSAETKKNSYEIVKTSTSCEIDPKIQKSYNEKVKIFTGMFNSEMPFSQMKKAKPVLLEIQKLEKENECLSRTGKLASIKNEIDEKLKSTKALNDQIKDNDLIERSKYYTELANLLK
jgi:hypothetical protein